MYLSTLEFILSPLGVILLFFIFFSIFLFWGPRYLQKKNSKLIKHFKGINHFFLGIIDFNYQSNNFSIVGLSNGGGSQVTSSFTVLAAVMESAQKFMIGHPESKNYCFFGDLPPFYQIVKIDEVDSLLLGADNLEEFEKALLKLNEFNDDELQNLKNLFSKKFNHIVIKNVIHVGGRYLFHKKCILHYVCLPPEIFVDPKMLESKLVMIINILNHFNKKIKK
jgi:hypothetical protein